MVGHSGGAVIALTSVKMSMEMVTKIFFVLFNVFFIIAFVLLSNLFCYFF